MKAASWSREVAVVAALAVALAAAFVVSLVFGTTWVPVSRIVAILAGAAGEPDGSTVVVEAIRLGQADLGSSPQHA